MMPRMLRPMHRWIVVAVLGGVLGCKAEKPSADVKPDPTSPTSAAAPSTATALASSPPASVIPPQETPPEATARGDRAGKVLPPTTDTAAPSATAVATEAPSASVAPSASAAPVASASARPLGTTKAVYAHAGGDHWNIDASVPPNCQSGTVCVVTIRIEALDDHHVNPAFGHKLIGQESPGMRFVGGNVFSVATGAFALQSEKVGVLTARFQADAPGSVTVTGTVKTSVCTASECLIPQAQITMSVPVL